MRELLYNAAKHFKRGKALSERGDSRGAMVAFEDALKDLHAVKPQRMRDVLLAQVYLSRYQLGRDSDPLKADSDLRLGYSYARTTFEPTVRQLAEGLWQERMLRPPVVPPRGPNGDGNRRRPPARGGGRADAQGGNQSDDRPGAGGEDRRGEDRRGEDRRSAGPDQKPKRGNRRGRRGGGQGGNQSGGQGGAHGG
ncbi:MAG: hypothetical protein KF875_13595 [Trueperaceae bacterium]|nr:hypothetical protein [Trueperaceae bacterium]MCC6309725.1 hypothetical protein [Trueperaceae bacterium]MCO5173861.1 hypothetical protein [Trueperaceae bacterium]MCW5818975.1 hypothetical protein [Trueperaceae bacterium]